MHHQVPPPPPPGSEGRRDPHLAPDPSGPHHAPGPPPPPAATCSHWELDLDLRHHIQHCACTCNHMGYGNYMDYQPGPRFCMGETIPCTRTTCLSELGPGPPLPLMNGAIRCNGQGHALLARAGSISSYSSDGDKRKQLILSACRALFEVTVRPWCVCMLCVLVCVVALLMLWPPWQHEPPPPHPRHLDSLEQRLDAVAVLLSEVPLIDGHNDLPWNIRKFVHNQLSNLNFSLDLRQVEPWSKSNWSHTDLPRLREGLVGAQFWSAYSPCGSQFMDAVQVTMEQIDVIRRLTEMYDQYLEFVTSVKELEDVHRRGKIASLVGVEGGHSLGNSLGVLRMYYDLGARYLTLTHTCHTPWAGCCLGTEEMDPPTEDENQGLSYFGSQVIRELNRLGMLVDLSHTSVRTMEDALNVSIAPIIFSHSSAFALCNSTRNVPDHVLKLVALNGGIVMVNFYSYFITCNQSSSLEDVIAHINHIRSVAGEDHVGIGAGYDGINSTPKGLEDVSMYPHLFAALMEDPTWTEEQLKKLAGLNFLRVFSTAEQVSLKFLLLN
ncbi:dipeptidase 1 isoform X3 [Nilaparvata lugens]|uniref:dipeptidase 1 isoform X3 n=1 Tax=Nilaparvata lugens TaxID=108931 RepID=UPI00193D5BCC|nr:dipeptidase 1 isoform X3 [Nilaparvata lugens]